MRLLTNVHLAKSAIAKPNRSVPNRSLQTGAIALVLLLSMALSGCRSRNQSTIENVGSNEDVVTAAEIENPETQVRITVPADWTVIRDERRQSADIQAAYPARNLHATVLSEDAAELSIYSLEDNSEQYRWLIQRELDRFDGETPTGLTSINGKRAVQYEIRGTVDGTSVVYLHTTVQGASDYYQVVGWTTAQSYEENRDVLQQVVQSFRGV